MHAIMLLADAAKSHGDGTFSLLRGGIDRVQSDVVAGINLKAALVIRLVGSDADAGQHDWRIRLVAPDGADLLKMEPQQLQIPDGGGAHVIAAEFSVAFPHHGKYAFEFQVGDRVLATWPIEVVPRTRGGAA